MFRSQHPSQAVDPSARLARCPNLDDFVLCDNERGKIEQLSASRSHQRESVCEGIRISETRKIAPGVHSSSGFAVAGVLASRRVVIILNRPHWPTISGFALLGKPGFSVAIDAGFGQSLSRCGGKALWFVNQTRSCLFKKTNVPSVNTIALTECEKVRRRPVR